ncbi:triose-phosphate isomerase [uncultured Mobiluncus sp.]|uniref:triose-phosphate isomerase n=1 Tax=uncultured Mobiluncus sp. TaxID=293425 RepID=UPI00260F0F90|nr:triose-phosphate isomerase [uncultured Mobiluncus sp.]
MARIPLMAGNWKMNLDHLEAIQLVNQLNLDLQDHRHDFSKVEVAVIPPFTDIRSVQTTIDGDDMKIKYGAQDVSTHDNGAYTGEVSTAMLTKLGCTYVVVGHSERREYHQESDAVVNEKARKVLAAGMVPIICCGEALEVRKAGKHVEHVLAQIEAGFDAIPTPDAAKCVVAYEPIWAIGTGETATPENAEEVCGAIRAKLAELYGQETADGIRVLYGGSVKSANVAELMAQPNVDGGLVGGASLKAEEFGKICRLGE